ncbi:MAG: gamma-glutamyltransferase, partial [Saprospiraceae bacterium]
MVKLIVNVSLLAVLVFSSCKQSNPEDLLLQTEGKTIKVSNAGLASAHPIATRIGADIMKKGGNAIDAAIATQFALAVCYPVAGNIGGGGFMVIKMNDGEVATLDYREKAPQAAHRDMYLDKKGDVIDGLSINGHLAVGVPGTVDGMIKAFQKYSKLKDWEALVQPSIDVSRNGFVITEKQAKRFNGTLKRWKKLNTKANVFTSKTQWKSGDLLIQPELALTFEAIRDQGEDGFYKGWVADSLVAEMNRSNGIITLNDLASYDAVWREPIRGTYRGLEIISMPPPSSGGIALIQLLNILENYDMSAMGFHSLEAIHHAVEAERRVYADRATHLGDNDFYHVPADALMKKEYALERMADFNPNKATLSADIKEGKMAKESEQTTHFSIIDEMGNAVSVTTTLNTGFGSKIVVGAAGFFLNNEMDDFSAKPGVPNFFGLVGNEGNSIQPGKRMLSSMTPTIVTKDGKVKIIVGSPGGSTIITSVLQIIMNILDFDMTASEAVAACRFHHQWTPDLLYEEPDCLGASLKNDLTDLGHTTKARGTIG